MTKNDIEKYITIELESNNFEDILENFDLTPQEVFWILFQEGLIDEEILERIQSV